jgi:hypothetical protein
LEIRHEFGLEKLFGNGQRHFILSNVVIPPIENTVNVKAWCAQEGLELSKMQSVSHRMGVLAVVERLRNQHDQAAAYKLAVLEQQKARRARCRKRFHFWATVAGQIENGLPHDAQ